MPPEPLIYRFFTGKKHACNGRTGPPLASWPPVEAAIREPHEGGERVLRAGPVEVWPERFVAQSHGTRVSLTVRELSLLTALIERRGRIVAREELYRVVWGETLRKSDRSVDVYVAKLRHKLAEAVPELTLIHTHFGFGYRLDSEG